jgi:hypothetical protein
MVSQQEKAFWVLRIEVPRSAITVQHGLEKTHHAWCVFPPSPPGNIPGTHFCERLSRPQGHSAAGRIMSMKNSSDNIGIRTRDLPTCSAVPQSTAPPRTL